MGFLRVVAKRFAMGFVAAWTVLTAVFAAFTMSRDWVAEGLEGRMRFVGADEAEIERAMEEYLATHGLDRPLWEQYVDWMGNMLTLEWGEAFFLSSEGGSGSQAAVLGSGDPVFSMVMDATVRTAMYILPAIGLAIALGLAVGVYAALHPESRLANAGLSTAYLCFALPNFWIGGMLVSLRGTEAVPNSALLFDHALPIALTATTLLGGYVSYSRAHSLEYASADFVTLVEAKGAGSLRVAKHIVRNAAIPLFSMLFTEALALLVLAVFVIESLFGIGGFGRLLFDAVHARDLPVVLGCTLVIIGVGIAGNVVQDLAYNSLDPRVDTGRR
ncbi:ABC transporter permease [Halobiforma lacisalsi AJ5]|uniref:ABC transporter permease n=1 Tax=Natronobacterium lacisalsi AJ5 TaxID=358396 RepID=M0LV69_NATLA|nr:ABC transporter permease [Halobiforma lacisalsi]APW99844.1 ABC transporter permease [Halobiforma lacisalsi AJ5]EMA35975.1 ABC transporter permease [Halobiforma lacisalsi AJ5]